MGSNKFSNLRSKKGTTMVEVLVSVLILAIVVVAVLTTISFSQRTIVSGSSQSKAAADAQTIADMLISQLNNNAVSIIQDNTIASAVYVDKNDFPKATLEKQFTIIPINSTDPANSANPDNIDGYQIKTAVYYTDSTGRKCVQMTAFAAKGGVSS